MYPLLLYRAELVDYERVVALVLGSASAVRSGAYPDRLVEVLAADNLRSRLGLGDGSPVVLTFIP